ncbi:DUF2867 domain-containing protein [Thalassospira sp.]|uniref:DUF2867 domain-containing protein n=1 Tax=Thalassospira sp. TaxID=1912094 RepID=UPI000C5C540B|nr:DUF2867 domain-containing protein [Thalassospira sp.]MBC06709.1 hypothetical protein [Thalassospira sp.]
MRHRASMRPVSIPHPAMPEGDWGDCFSITTSASGLTPEIAARQIMGSRPNWVVRLMLMRDFLMRPFGLKSGMHEPDNADVIGIFPVIARDNTSITLGLNDRHLDFRLVIELEPTSGEQTHIHAITIVKRHNIFGRLYLATITPFHNRIVPAMLNSAYAA